jgi:hypothetical protein
MTAIGAFIMIVIVVLTTLWYQYSLSQFRKEMKAKCDQAGGRPEAKIAALPWRESKGAKMNLDNRWSSDRQDRFKEAAQKLIELRLELSHFHMRLLSVIPPFSESEIAILWSGFTAEMARIDQELDLQDKPPIDSTMRPYIDAVSPLTDAIDTTAGDEGTRDLISSLAPERRFALIGALDEAGTIARDLVVTRRSVLSLNPTTFDMAYIRGYSQPRIARETGLNDFERARVTDWINHCLEPTQPHKTSEVA